MTRQNRFFINSEISKELQGGNEIVITDPALLNEWVNVIRLRSGDEVFLLDNTGQVFHGRIQEILKKVSRIAKVDVQSFAKDMNVSQHLYACMLKKDKFEWVIQKATELGVEAIHPVISNRTEKLGFRSDRAALIAKEASEQSGRYFLPEINEPLDLEKSLDDATQGGGKILFADFDGDSLVEIKKEIKKRERVNLFIGPEGGWTDEERKMFLERGAKKVSLGKNILRAETASVAGCAILLAD